MFGSSVVVGEITYTREAEAQYIAPITVEQVIKEEKEVCDDSVVRCNCYLFVRQYIPGLPRSTELVSNSPPKIGSVALFTYPSGLRHYAYVIALGGSNFTVKECNFKRGICGQRDVSYDDPSLDGWWFPPIHLTQNIQNTSTY